MSTFDKLFLKPGEYNVRGRKVQISADDLAEYARNTTNLLSSGYRIPIYDKHPPIGANGSGPRIPGDGASALDSLGWVKKMTVNSDGSLTQRIKVTDPVAAEKISNGSIEFVSPELLRRFSYKNKDICGPVITHVALTNTPRTQDQGSFESVDEGALQFSLDDYEGPIQMADDNEFTKKKNPTDSSGESDQATNAAESTAEIDSDNPGSPPESPPVETPEVNPDMPKNKASEQEAEVLRARLEEAGLFLPTTVDITNPDELISHLITALATKSMAKEEAKEEVAEAPEPEPIIEETPPMTGSQFSADSPEAIELVELRKDKAERIASDVKSTRDGLVTRLAKLPKGIAIQFGADLKDDLGGLQFSADGSEEPMFTLTEVLDRLDKAIPRVMQFSADGNEATEQEHPGGDAFTTGEEGMSDDRADKIAAESTSWSNDNSMRVDTPSAEREVSAV